MEVTNTRLRYISAKTAPEISGVVSALPFKIEMKQLAYAGGRWYAWFVIPDNVKEFKNREL